jgi:hypothetical protein
MALLMPLAPTVKAWLVLAIFPHQTAAYLTKILTFSFELIKYEHLFQPTHGFLHDTIGALKNAWSSHAITVLGILISLE